MTAARRPRQTAAASRPTASRPAPPPPPAAEEVRGPRIDARAVLVGLVSGQLLLLLLVNGGLIGANSAFGPQDRIDGGVVGVGTFIAVLCGGLIAARLAARRVPHLPIPFNGRHAFWQGMAVGIGFILVGILYDFATEVQLVHDSFSATGSDHFLVDLGPMRIDRVITGDVLALFGGSAGGYLGRGRPRPR